MWRISISIGKAIVVKSKYGPDSTVVDGNQEGGGGDLA
jgi:hypothetical protein